MARWWWDDDDVSLFPYVVFFNETSVFCFLIFVFSVDWLTEEIIDRPLFLWKKLLSEFRDSKLDSRCLWTCMILVCLVFLCLTMHFASLALFPFPLFSISFRVQPTHTIRLGMSSLSAILYQREKFGREADINWQTMRSQEGKRDETFVMQMFVFSVWVDGCVFFLRRE